MLEHKRMRALLAQSLYEELEADERARLDKALETDPGLREEMDALKGLVDDLPVSEVPFDGDLRGAVRERIAAPAAPGRARMWVPAGAALALVLAIGAFAAVSGRLSGQGDRVAETSGAAGQSSAMSEALAVARRNVSQGNFTGAYVALTNAVTGRPRDERAFEAQQLLADLAYEELRWYPEAWEAYRALSARDGERFAATPENTLRLNLLDEARGPDEDFASLDAMDKARNDGLFESFERVVSRFPGTYVASLSASEMAALAIEDSVSGADGGRLLAMQTALDRCAHPIAVAQLTMEVGAIYRDDVGNPLEARKRFEDVADSEYTVLAELASEALEKLDGPSL